MTWSSPSWSTTRTSSRGSSSVARWVPTSSICAWTDYSHHPGGDRAKIGPGEIVSVTHVSNVLGVENDVAAIGRRAHEMGAYFVVDGAQSVPHMRGRAEIGCDLMAFSAHKLGGPMGIGVLWGRSEVLDAMPPFLTGGEMIDSVTETDRVGPVPQKFEAGTQDAAGSYAFDADLTYLESIGMEKIEARERILARYLADRLASLDFVDVIGPSEGSRHVGAVAFNVRGIHPTTSHRSST